MDFDDLTAEQRKEVAERIEELARTRPEVMALLQWHVDFMARVHKTYER